MTNTPRPAPENETPEDEARDARTRRFARLVAAARLVVGWERLWPALWPALGIAALFVALSWAGLWLALPPIGRIAGCALFGLALLLSLVPLVRLNRPKRSEALARLDRDAIAGHRPASTLDDTLAAGADDPGAQTLWKLHRQRAERGLDALRLSAPRPDMALRDRYALRGAAILALVASAFLAGPELGQRLGSAFDWRGFEAQSAGYRIDGWIDPPIYTRLPPVILDLASAAPKPVRAPVGSTLVIRMAGRTEADISASSGLEAQKQPDAPKTRGADLIEKRFTVKGDATISVRAGGLVSLGTLSITAIPDTPPTIRFAEPPQPNARGSLTIAYEAKDDYGIAGAEAFIERADQGPVRRSLVPPPQVTLALPVAGESKAKTLTDLSAHPWAGAKVRMTLVARDEAGQEGRSEAVTLTLPQRPFTKPLAKALVEQRRDLIVDPERKDHVQTALDALTIAPELFTPEPGIYLGLRIAGERLRGAKTDADLVDLADYLWQMALQIEDGDLSAAERNLRAAQEALRQAIERGADESEIRKLTKDLREAMNRFISEFAQRQRQNNARDRSARSDAPSRMVTPDDLQRMLDRIEELNRQGATAEAQRLLDELRNILENLQTARPGGSNDQMQQEFDQTMNDLDAMIREQQDLRDETYRDGQRQMDGRQRGDRQSGRNQGQRRPGERQQGQQGQNQQGQQNGQNQSGQSLAERQQALRDKLAELQRRMKGMGLQGEQGLEEAEREMGDAQGQLGEGRSADAVDPQGRALEGMRKGAQGLARQMDGQGEGDQQTSQDGNGAGRPGGRQRQDAADTDPLGRPTRGREMIDGRVQIPGESAAARARRILDELRKRLGDPERPREELDYFERLLKPR